MPNTTTIQVLVEITVDDSVLEERFSADDLEYAKKSGCVAELVSQELVSARGVTNVSVDVYEGWE